MTVRMIVCMILTTIALINNDGRHSTTPCSPNDIFGRQFTKLGLDEFRFVIQTLNDGSGGDELLSLRQVHLLIENGGGGRKQIKLSFRSLERALPLPLPAAADPGQRANRLLYNSHVLFRG